MDRLRVNQKTCAKYGGSTPLPANTNFHIPNTLLFHFMINNQPLFFMGVVSFN